MDDLESHSIKARWSGIEYYTSYNNRESNNTRKRISGTLATELTEKLALAEQEDTFSQKGWFSCEIEEGRVDPACVEREKAKGFQGVPREYLPYSSLMADFEGYVNEEFEGEEIGQGEPKEKLAKDAQKEKLEEQQKEPKQSEPNDKDLNSEDNDPIIEELRESWQAALIVILVLISVIVFLYVSKKGRAK